MHLKSLKIKNFRALEDIYVEFSDKVSVIVGPNAAGKTTILEAIRLVKGLLAPRTQNEAVQILQSLGVASPHLPNRLRAEAMLRDINIELVIGCRFSLGQDELNLLNGNADAIARNSLQAQFGQSFAAPDAFVAFLATDQGKQALLATTSAVHSALKRITPDGECYLEVAISAAMGIQSKGDPLEAQLIAFLERSLPPYKTYFTHFPADRALPAGEQQVQLGGPDAAQQLESYNSQPQSKFNRLKNTIFSAAVLGDKESTSEKLAEQFNSIFSGILKGRKLAGIGVNEIGMLSALVQDIESGRVFDLDGMSSGEKGLILTFLLIARSVQDFGMVLLDEPELHLNPAVCKDLLAYMIDNYAIPKNLQIIICSHSPEILAGAFDSDECSLYHLISSTTLSKVRLQDEATVGAALRRLGANQSENLLYRGVIFVEGPDDVALLEAGFGHLLKRFRLKYSTGRNEVEKAISAIQDIERENTQDVNFSPTYFIFDKDDAPTSLHSTRAAKVLQWKRRCLENFLLDVDCVANLLMDNDILSDPFDNVGDVTRLLRSLAWDQLDERSVRAAYARYTFQGLGLRKADVEKKTPIEASKALLQNLITAKNQLDAIDISQWQNDFEKQVTSERSQLESKWDATWQQDCDGKRLLEDLYKRKKFKMPLKKLKVRLMREIAHERAESWNAIENELKNLLGIS